MATLNTKIANFINKAQTKVRELAKLLISNFDRQGYQSADSEDLLLKLYETRNFIELLNTTDRGGMTDKQINDLIDFFWKWLELNKISFVNYPNLTTNIQENIIVPSGTYALQADLVAEVQARTNADVGLDERIQVLEGFDPETILPPNFFDNQVASNVNVWDDDTRLHTHANKDTLDDLTAELLTALQALEAHYASIGETAGVHVSTDDRNGWNAKVTVAQLNALSTVYAPLSHTQAGADKHTISQITGLNDLITQLNLDISNMAGIDGREVELQSPDGDEIQWRYVGDEDWISLGNFKGDAGEAGDPFTVDFRGLSSGRLSSAFDGEDEGFAYLETDTGYLYFRNPAGGPATSSAGWEDPIRFVGDNGWSPVLAVFEVSSDKAVFEIVDWVGGSGIKPVFDPGLSPPDPVRWFIGPAGVTLETSVAVNIRGPQGYGFGPIIGGAGTLAARSAFDANAAGFIYLQTDVSPQVIYIKNTDTAADWGGPYAWQGITGSSGPPGSGLGKLVDQAAHGLTVFTAVSFRAGAYEQFDSAMDDIWLGVITAVGSSSLFTFVQAGYVSGLSGLVANSLYFVQDDGTISTVDTGRPVFFAISTTEGYVLSGAGASVPTLNSVLSVGNDAEGQDIVDLGNLTLRSGKVVDVEATGGSDVLNVGTANADVINIGRSGAVINFLGAAANYTETQHYITDKLITLNKDGGAASGVGSGIEIEENAIITGYIKTNATRDGYSIKAPANAFVSDFSLSLLTADRVHSLPDVTGTIALFSQITAGNAGAWSLATGAILTNVNTITSNTSNWVNWSGTIVASANSQYFERTNIDLTARATASDSLTGNIYDVRFTVGSTNQALNAFQINATYYYNAPIATVEAFASALAGCTPTTYNNVPASSTNGLGVGALFTVVVSGAAAVSSITATTAGTGYSIGDLLVFNGSLFGGSGTVTWKVLSVTGKSLSGHSVLRLNDNTPITVGPSIERVFLDFRVAGTSIGSIGTSINAAGVGFLSFKSAAGEYMRPSSGAVPVVFPFGITSGGATTLVSPTITGTTIIGGISSTVSAGNSMSGAAENYMWGVGGVHSQYSAGITAGFDNLTTFRTGQVLGGVIVGGSGYTDGTYLNCQMTGGTGTLFYATITVAGGAVTVVTPTNLGYGYTIGDVCSSSDSRLGAGSSFTYTVNDLDINTSTHYAGYRFRATIQDPTSNYEFTGYLSNPILNFTGTNTAKFRAFYHNPSYTASVGFSQYAWEHTGGMVAWSSILSPAQITANQNDYNPTGLNNGGAPNGATVLRLDTNASRNLTSVVGGVSGRVMVLTNIGTNPLVLTHDDGATGTAANRFKLPNGKHITLRADDLAFGFYDVTTGRWRVLGGVIQDTGWTKMTGTTTKGGGYDTGTVTLPQLAAVVKALTDHMYDNEQILQA